MALTTRTHVSDGAQTLYDVDFNLGYIQQSYVYVYLEGNHYTDQLSYTWISATQIQLSEPVATDASFIIRRIIPRNLTVNDFKNGAIIHESNLDDSYAQLLMILEEISDGFIEVDGNFKLASNLDMQGNRVTNVGEAINPTDAPNLGQLEGYEQTSGESAIAAEASAVRAEEAVVEAEALVNVFTDVYAGSGQTLPTGVQIEGIRFHYLGAAYPIGEYIYLLDFTDPVTNSNWHEVSGIGPQGPQGPQGIQGFQGDQGLQGLVGVNGPQGIDGPQGIVGPQGPIGVTGATGGAGPQGVQGVVGPTGPAGSSYTVDATGLLAGRSAYDSEAQGFSFLATDTSDLYIRDSATPGDWSDPIAFGVGPQGEQGPVGIQGPQGSLGPTGAEGPDGPQGIAGIDGQQGPQGVIGVQGDQGEQGILGAPGPQGAQGPIGANGPQGNIGPQGITGTQGTQGVVGPTGPEGDQGPIGNQGIRGSRSFYVSGRTSWSVTVANTAIPDTPLENDIVVQYDGGTGFSETRRLGTGAPTILGSWDIVDQVIRHIPSIIAGVSSDMAISATASLSLGTNTAESGQGSSAIALGTNAGRTDQGDQTVAVGQSAGNVTQADRAVAVGYQAGRSAQGNGGVAVGHGAGETSQGAGGVAVGVGAGANAQATDAIAIGTDAGGFNQDARAIAIGMGAGFTEAEANSICIGVNAGKTGAQSSSISIGDDANGDGVFGNTATYAGVHSIAIGSGADSLGNEAVAIGRSAKAAGQDATAIGEASSAGAFRSTAIGSSAGSATTSYDESTSLGFNATPTAAHQMTLGYTNITNLRCNDTSISSLSDARDKTAGIVCPIGLDYINDLQPREFTWNYRDDHKDEEGNLPTKHGTKELGFYSQELKTVQDAYNMASLKSYQHYPSVDGSIDIYEADSGKLLPVLVRAIQELSAKIVALEA